jgi:hypothetical protein
MNRKDLPSAPLRRAVYVARAVVSTSPGVYLPFARRKYADEAEDRVLRPDTQLVIEGYQRSGNTFATVAFELAQREPVRIAHHLHAAAQVIAAVRMGIPVLVLVRDPVDTVLSHIIREPGIRPREALWNWSRFYEAILPVRDRIVVARFDVVTSDLGSVIARVNERYETSFDLFEHTDANVSRCFEIIEDRNRHRYGSISETTVPRPSVVRHELKDALRAEISSTRLAEARARAYAAYAAMSTRTPVA